MALRSKEFIGKAEGIKSHELSVKSLMEKLKGTLSNLSSQKGAIERRISYLYAELAAAENDTDDDGDPDYGLIASIENQIDQANDDLDETEQEISQTSDELEKAKKEYEQVEEEKQQTLFEIQQRARTTSQNLSSAGSMYGAYADVGASLNQSFQASFDALAQAAAILDGSVGTTTGSSRMGGSPNAHSGEGRGIASAIGAAAIVGANHISSTKSFSGSYATNQSSHGSHSGSGIQSYSGKKTGLKNGAAFRSSQTSLGKMKNTTGSLTKIRGYGKNFSTNQSGHSDNNNSVSAIGINGNVSSKMLSEQVAHNSSVNNVAIVGMKTINNNSYFEGNVESPVSHASTSNLGSRQHTFADWINPDNYKDGRYIGAGQSWGYKPYGNDSSEFATTIMSPAQQALVFYMQKHNYGKDDFAKFSSDSEWQKLHKASYPNSGLFDAIKGTALARQQLSDYMYAHNYTQADFATYSRDAEWQLLHQMAYPDSNIINSLVGTQLAKQHLIDYMYEHNYGQADFAIYSKDEEWQRLHKNAYPDNYSRDGHFKYGEIIESDHITYSTKIDSSVKDLPHLSNLSKDLRDTFLNSQYRTVITTEDIKLYRVYGGVSKKEGTYLTSEIPTDRMAAKMGLALKADWKNSRESFSEVTIPKGTVLNIGKAAPQISASGHVLPGGMDQIVISREFVSENSHAFGEQRELSYKTGYKKFNKKADEIEKEIEDENRKFVNSVLHKTNVYKEIYQELTEQHAEMVSNTMQYIELLSMPNPKELDLAMAKADVFSSVLGTGLITVGVFASALKDFFKKK